MSCWRCHSSIARIRFRVLLDRTRREGERRGRRRRAAPRRGSIRRRASPRRRATRAARSWATGRRPRVATRPGQASTTRRPWPPATQKRPPSTRTRGRSGRLVTRRSALTLPLETALAAIASAAQGFADPRGDRPGPTSSVRARERPHDVDGEQGALAGVDLADQTPRRRLRRVRHDRQCTNLAAPASVDARHVERIRPPSPQPRTRVAGGSCLCPVSEEKHAVRDASGELVACDQRRVPAEQAEGLVVGRLRRLMHTDEAVAIARARLPELLTLEARGRSRPTGQLSTHSKPNIGSSVPSKNCNSNLVMADRSTTDQRGATEPAAVRAPAITASPAGDPVPSTTGRSDSRRRVVEYALECWPH